MLMFLRLTTVAAGVLALITVYPRPAPAAQDHGPKGAGPFEHVHALAVDGEARSLLLGAHTGLFRSEDGGKSWQKVGHKLHAAVREKGEGIYRTTDAGAKWTRVDDGPGGEVKVLSSVNISTGMGGIWLYAGTAEGLQPNPDCF